MSHRLDTPALASIAESFRRFLGRNPHFSGGLRAGLGGIRCGAHGEPADERFVFARL